MRLMTCANQVGKSVGHIWDKIDRATNIERWPELWAQRPDLFWFFYTDQDTCNREVVLKWKKWLPQGKYRDSAQYGWELDADRREKEIRGIKFNSGVWLEFKFYTQSPKNLQSATVFDVGADEEMPEPFWDEIYQRISGPNGYFSACFTATLNQQMWWRAMEGKGESEQFPDAWKLQVSKYACIAFDDGSPGLYTEERVKEQEAMCSSQAQVDRRILGKFAAESGRKYWAFDANRHYIKPCPIPPNWTRYSGVDIGSGGGKGHPAAFYFIAVSPDCRLGYIYKGRRMDGVETTAGDVFNAYVAERGGDNIVVQSYDYHSKDFGLIAERAGEPFVMADKNHERGEEVINTLFQNDMLFLFDTPEVTKIGSEMLTLMRDTDKRLAKDDASDATRYGLMPIPWDWTALQAKPTEEQIEVQKTKTQAEYLADEIRQRRGEVPPKEDNGWAEFEDEIGFWNGQYGSD